MPTPTASHDNTRSDKYKTLKRSIFIGTLLILGIIGWHFYEHFILDKTDSDDQGTAIEQEIIQLTQKLFVDELTHNPYLDKVNFQGRTKSFARDDRASQPLLQLNSALLAADTTSTVNLMKRLFDNYELDTYAVEKVTPEEEQEEMDFLHAVMNTPIMKRTMTFLQIKGIISANYNTQLQLLKDLWFTQYSRGRGRVGSSGFEHVFLAEIKDQQSVLGLHNWIYFSEQEQKGHLDYKGYIDRIDWAEQEEKSLIAARFTFHGIVKPYNTLFIGTSPEFEMSLYTVCFLLSLGDTCFVHLGTTKFNIITYAWDWRGKKVIASAYPSIEY